MIVCLEGASAVGKTSTCRLLAERLNACVIPEVNALFTRPADAHENWYLERQVDRWALACEAEDAGQLAVLDGDPFQPLWYNWSFGFRESQPLDALIAFYRPLIASGDLRFSDLYVHLVTNMDELRRRKEGDPTRSRRNFESHLCLMEMQPRYFDAMASLTSSMVYSVEAVSVDSNSAAVVNILQGRPINSVDALAVFDGMAKWLRREGFASRPANG
ncbi:MAG: hypothetical protein JWQ02_3469 [Capsulimonas sp.]|nr:hypothetical protein [Capsulimonas sp.]